MNCPRCSHEQQSSVECESCGVLFARLSSVRRRSRTPHQPSDATSTSWVAPALIVGIVLLSSPVIYHHITSRLAKSAPSATSGSRSAVAPPPAETGQTSSAQPESRQGPTEPTSTSTPGRAATADTDTTPNLSSTAETASYVADLERRVAIEPVNIRLRLELSSAQTTLGEHYLRERRFRSARETLSKALEHDPTNKRIQLLIVSALHQAGSERKAQLAFKKIKPGAQDQLLYHTVRADMYYAEGHLQSALEWLLEALQIAPGDESIAARIVRIRRQLAGDSDAELETRHFMMVFTGRADEVLAQQLAEVLEQIYFDLTHQLPVDGQRITALLYSDVDHRYLTDAPDWAAGAGPFDGKLRIPVAGLGDVDPRTRAALAHELAHALIYARGGESVPRWLHEGLALHFDGRRLEDFELAREERESLASGPPADDRRLESARSLWLVEFYLSRFSHRSMLALLDGTKNGSLGSRGGGGAYDRALFETTRLNSESFESEFRKWAASKL